MSKHLVLGVVLTALLAGGAAAQQAGTGEAVSPEDCVQTAYELAQTAEQASLSDEEANKLEEMLIKMEAHCDAKQFTEAAAVAADVKAAIAAKQ